MSTKTLLVTGATGKQGGAVINALLSRFTHASNSNSTSAFPSPAHSPPIHILALTRDPTSRAAHNLLSLSRPHLTLLKGDLNSPSHIFSSLPTSHPHIHGIFSVQLPKFGLGAADVASEERQGKELVDAAIRHGHVERFVYSSVDRGGGEDEGTYVPHFRSKYRIEQYLRERVAAAAAAAAASDANAKGEVGKNEKEKKMMIMTYTILRTVAFFENLTSDFAGRVFATIWQGQGPQSMQLISTRDLGWFAAEALMGTSTEYENTAMSVAGDVLNFKEANHIYRRVLGRDMPTTLGPVVRALRWGMADLDLMFKWLKENQCRADVEECRRRNEGLLNFETWLRENKVKG